MADLHTSLVPIDIVYDKPVRLSSRVRRITARNPSPFTGPGTNTYIVGQQRFCVIDPGPADAQHIDAILEATAGKIDYVFATHAHPDHSPAALPLVQATGARMMGLLPATGTEGLDYSFAPDESLLDNEVVDAGEVRLRVIETPGHLKQHLCFLLEEEALLFAGDHVMQGASVVIVPNHGGTMWDYLDSLRKLQGLGLRHLAPAHGHLLAQPDRVLQELIDHRMAREKKVVEALRQLRQASTEALAPLVYPEIEGDMIRATHVALWAHLQKLVRDGLVIRHQRQHWLIGEVMWEFIDKAGQ